jgi:hypothetical protein
VKAGGCALLVVSLEADTSSLREMVNGLAFTAIRVLERLTGVAVSSADWLGVAISSRGQSQ